MGLVGAGAAVAGAAARTGIASWLWSIGSFFLRNPFKTTAITGAAAHVATGGKSTDIAVEKTKEGAAYAFKEVTDIDPNIDLGLTAMLGKFWDWLVEKFENNTGSLIVGGTMLLTMFSANGGALGKTVASAGAGLAAYFGLKYFFPQMFNSKANPPGMSLTHDATLEKAGSEQAATKSETEAVPLKKGLALNFENTNKTTVEPVLPREKEMQEEPIIDEPGNEPS